MKLFWKWHKIFWIIFTTIILLLALLYGSLRAATPWIVSHPESVKKFLSQTLATPTSFDELNISWRVFGPTIKFRNLQLNTKENDAPLLTIQRLEFRYSFLKNFLSWDIYPRATLISGLTLSLNEVQENRWLFNGIELPASKEPWYKNQQLRQLLGFIYSQQFLRLKNTQLTLQFFQKPSYQFKDLNLKLKKSYTSSTLFGSLSIQQKASLPVKYLATFRGTPLLNSDWSADVHLELAKIHLMDWLPLLAEQKNWQLQNGDGVFSFWFQLNKNKLRSVTTEFDASNIAINEQSKQKKFVLKTAKGVVSWQRDSETEWNIRAAPLHLLFVNGTNLPFDSELMLSKKRLAEKKPIVYEFMVDKISISNMSTFLHFFTEVPSNIEEWLKQLKPQGELHEIRLQLPSMNLSEIQPESIALDVGFSELTTNAYKNFPALKNFQGELSFTLNKGQISFDNQQTSIYFPTLFAKPIAVKDLVGSFEWQKTDKGLKIQAKNLLVNSSELQTRNDLQLLLPPDGSSPEIALITYFSGENINTINPYLPVKIMNPKLANWLQYAIKNIKKITGQVTLKGSLYDFPFDSGNGNFDVHADLTDATLVYLPQWPQITNLKGALGFHNRRMKVKVANAEVLGAKLTKVIAVIPRITTDETDWLSIHGETETDVSNGIEFVQKTPQLMQKLGGVFASLQGHGPMKFALDLTIPFSKKAIPTRYEAKMALNKAELAVVPWHLVLKDVIGNVYLTEKSVVTDKVTANVFDSPVTLNVTTNDPGKLQSKIVSKMNGHIALDKLQPILGNDFLNFVKGETDYQAILTIPYQSPAAFVFEILSDLKGITLQLPTPFSKKASTENLFRFALTAPKLNQTTLITLSMLNQWNALLLFSNEKNIKTLDKAIIQIGKEMPELPERSAIVLSGYLPTLPLDEWEKFSKQLPRNKSDNVLPFILDMRTDNFDLGGMSIPNPRIQIQTTSVSKIVSIDSQIVTGSVEIPNEKTNKPLDVRLRRLSIMPRSDTKAGTVSIDKIPAMRVLIDQFQYNNKNFGKVSFALNKQSKNMISIDNLEVAAPNLAVIAKGKWMTSGTELAGTLRISQLARALKAWGYPPAINSKQTEVKFNLNWSGSPAAFALAKLNGIFDLTMTNGSIEQLDQSTEAKLGIGKLLSIMSLQTLPRLFSFDFSAVTNKGFTFDRITSRFQLKMGNANTNNLEIEGPVARVLMKGRIGLAAEDYDVQVQINPHVTQGIPVVAAFAGGPIAGATALVVNQLIGDKVVGSIVSYSYTLKGSWQKPIIQENVNGKK